MLFQKVLPSTTSFSWHSLISAAISQNASSSAARKIGSSAQGGKIITRTAPPLLPCLLLGSLCTDLRMN